MINENGLWRGQNVSVREWSETERERARYEVRLRNREIVGEFYSRDWANVFAEVVESFIPVGVDPNVRYIYEGLLSLAATRLLVAGVLERAAEKHVAAALEQLDSKAREHHQRVAEQLRVEAKRLQG